MDKGTAMTSADAKNAVALADANDDWQDWPSDPLPADGSKTGADLWLAKWAEQPLARKSEHDRLPDRPAPEDRGSVPAAPEEPPAPDAGSERKPRRAKKIVLVVAALLILAGGAWYGRYWWTTGRYLVSTDDAYVGAKNATLAAKVTGYVSDILVDDNAHVHEGDVIVRIDDGDYRLAVETARDNLATQQATIDRIGKQIAAQQAAVDQARAQLSSAQAGAKRAELELKRQQELAARGFASHQTLEQAQSNRDQGNAAVQAGQAAVAAAAATVDVLKAQQVEAQHTLKQLQTALAKAERDLSFTVIRAPFDGMIGNRATQVGDLVQPGQRLASLVPMNAIFIDANFKETQLAALHPGQPVAVSVDAYSDHQVEGKVVSIAPASGSVFSLLPPDNATGNFTKIVQRLPVRIEVPTKVAEEGLLRPGMSVVVSVNTKPGAAADSTVATQTSFASSRVR